MSNNEYPEEYYIFALYYLILKDEQDKYDLWDKFEHDIIYNNRFSADNEIIKDVHSKQKEATLVLKKDSYYYRARVHDNTSIDKLFRYYLKEQGQTDAEIEETIHNISDFDKESILAIKSIMGTTDDTNDTDKLLSLALKKWKKNVKYKGYNAKDSGAPDADKIKNGRANPDHIRYLYVSEDKETPIYEIRPKITDNVSLAKAKLLRDAKVFDLTKSYKKANDNTPFKEIIETVGAKFSQPVNGNDEKYIPTQYLAEEIKKMGFDGIRFKSSVHKSGNNIVFFDPGICKFVSSDLFTVNDIKIDIDYHYLYHLGEMPEQSTN